MVQGGGNSIGGAISDDGKLVAVSNYEPGGVRSLTPKRWIWSPMSHGLSKTVGIADVPGAPLYPWPWDTGEVWLLDHSADPAKPVITKLTGIGANPYDALLTGDGRTYIVGLFGERADGGGPVAGPAKVTRFLPDYGRTSPICRSTRCRICRAGRWRMAFSRCPAGSAPALWVDAANLTEIARTDLAGQPVFAVARPDKRGSG